MCNIKNRYLGTVILGCLLALGVPRIAYGVEGTFTTYVTQVQPGFAGRSWQDAGHTKDATVITLANCKVNKGGAAYGSSTLSSVSITLYQNGKAVKTIKQKCGTYNFGNYGPGRYYFTISAINDNKSANRTTFLNADPLKVSY